MTDKILFRNSDETDDEFHACQDVFGEIYEYRSQIPENTRVIPRYSVLPYYEELEEELKLKRSYLINSYEQHRYVADIQNWYPDLKEYTPKTYFIWSELGDGKYVVKGRTNSRKHQWNRRMFAEGREQLLSVIRSLMDDSFVNDQGLCVREYIPLVTYGTGINDIRFTNEWRCFFLGNVLISYGYYWSHSHYEKPKDLPRKAIQFVNKIASIVSEFIEFFVVDIAQTETGDWIVIELNDAQMSGLSDINPNQFYRSLKEYL